jgi:ribonucleoside-diphosphate reductase alpha chain
MANDSSVASDGVNSSKKKLPITKIIGATAEDKKPTVTRYGKSEQAESKTVFDNLFKKGFEPTSEMIKKVGENIANNEDFIAGLNVKDRTTFKGEGHKLEGVREKVLLDRYSLKNEKGEAIEFTPEEIWTRVAWGVAQIEKTPEARKKWEKKFYEAMDGFHFVPAGRILSGAGTGYAVTYYNCYVLPSPDDSRGGILDNIKDMVEVMARAGGVGINLSTLRPKGSYIKSVNGHSSGPMSWAQLYSVATGDVVIQGGSRRGALMLMLNDDHPDIEEFITCKLQPHWIEHANLSIAASDGFMDAIKNDADWDLKWEGKVVKTVRARDLWDKICKAAWQSAEPGFVFMERYNKWSNTWYYEDINCVNPCGEQGLGPWSVCNLGSLNLSAYVTDGEMDWQLLADHSRTATRMLDNVIDSNYYFFEENKLAQLGTRRIGLGTMGLADALIKMKIRYGSDESLTVIEKIYQTVRDNAYDASVDLAIEKGAFPYFDSEKYMQGHFIQQLPAEIQERIREHGTRNGVLISQQPTGTISLFSGCSSGIEPVYDFATVRRDRTGEHIMYHPLYEEWKNAHPDEVAPDYFASTNDLTPEDHIKVQAAVQKYTDASISKTVNAPNGYTVDQVKELYMKSYDMGCKGITFYRDGSRDAVLTRVADEQKDKEAKAAAAVPVPTVVDQPELSVTMRERPEVLQGSTYKVKTPVGTGYVTINHDGNGEMFEVFLTISRAGSDIYADADAIGRLISLALRIPTSVPKQQVVETIVDQLSGIGGSSSVGFGANRVRSLADAVAKAINEHNALFDKQKVLQATDTQTVNMFATQAAKSTIGTKQRDLCMKCGEASLVYEEGCMKCYSCGYSKC